jgi:hypothetical protein
MRAVPRGVRETTVDGMNLAAAQRSRALDDHSGATESQWTGLAIDLRMVGIELVDERVPATEHGGILC